MMDRGINIYPLLERLLEVEYGDQEECLAIYHLLPDDVSALFQLRGAIIDKWSWDLHETALTGDLSGIKNISDKYTFIIAYTIDKKLQV